MSLLELEKLYLNGGLQKSEFISRMYVENHDILFQYSKFIKNRDIEKIEITDDSVIMTSRENGIKIICSKYDERIAPIEILNFKAYEKECSDMIFRLVNDGDTIFDIGCNVGWYSITLCKIKRNLDIHAFEPIPKTYERFIDNIQINGANIKAYNLGLSDKKEDIVFFYYKEGSVNASSAIMDDTREHDEIRCHVDRLDNVFLENGLTKLDFIKCDVEGAELLAFKGGSETIDKYKPVIFTEMLRKWAAKFNYHPNIIIQMFNSMGYRCYITSKGRLIEMAEMTDETVETNFFFLHDMKHSSIIDELRV